MDKDKARMKWDLQANHDLLFCLIQELSPNQDQLRGVMDRMHEYGYPCTVKAITQHLQKLRRKENNTAANDGGEGSSAAAEASTPAAKRGKAAGKKTPASAKRKAADNDTDDEQPTPTKKPRRIKMEDVPIWKSRVKDEEDDDEGPDLDPYGVPRAATTHDLPGPVGVQYCP
ncbi:hypothetical protein QBC40DRAFT_248800 [Triangularia verruculosa]|uniref:Uncharacterized protein n=1 Tax=Triangularia verruculosa TaxID=2587418 RepID=A0AAN6XS94_9PEZI|nr:hypothetical protein QBC40DRAFT_248800 [Triangularia verruculosa]